MYKTSGLWRPPCATTSWNCAHRMGGEEIKHIEFSRGSGTANYGGGRCSRGGTAPRSPLRQSFLRLTQRWDRCSRWWVCDRRHAWCLIHRRPRSCCIRPLHFWRGSRCSELLRWLRRKHPNRRSIGASRGGGDDRRCGAGAFRNGCLLRCMACCGCRGTVDGAACETFRLQKLCTPRGKQQNWKPGLRLS